jgi:hypothetical protein
MNSEKLDPTLTKKLLYLYSCAILLPEISAGKFEICILSRMFNFDMTITQCITTESKKFTKEKNKRVQKQKRVWKLLKHSYANEIQYDKIPVMSDINDTYRNSLGKDLIPIYMSKVDNSKYLLLQTKQVCPVDLVSPPRKQNLSGPMEFVISPDSTLSTVVRTHLGTWARPCTFDYTNSQFLQNAFHTYLNSRENKWFKKLRNSQQFDRNNKMDNKLGPMFDYDDFVIANIDPRNVMPIVRMLDPFAVLVKEDIHPLYLLQFRDVATLRHESWVVDTVLQQYVDILNDTTTFNSKFLFIDPATLIDISASDTKFNNMVACAEDSDLLIMCMCVNSNHYITIEASRMLAIEKDCWLLEITDSLMNENNLEHYKKIIQSSSIYKLITQLWHANVQYSFAKCVQQNNGYDCAIECMRRFYYYSTYGETMHNPS